MKNQIEAKKAKAQAKIDALQEKIAPLQRQIETYDAMLALLAEHEKPNTPAFLRGMTAGETAQL